MPTYAIADKVPASARDYLTPGKPYLALNPDKRGFDIVAHVVNDVFCLWEGCQHLDGGNWRRVESDTPPAQPEDALLSAAKALLEAMDIAGVHVPFAAMDRLRKAVAEAEGE